jgi:hypothetical protein
MNEDKLKVLKKGYNFKIRLFEIISILTNICLTTYIIYTSNINNFYYLYFIPLSWLSADIISGLVHWLADTYGKVTWPIIGNTFIRSFLEHHIDPKSITEHDWIETNGANFFIGIPLLIFLIYQDHLIPTEICVFFAMTNIWTALTNQFHKWAHQDNNPFYVIYMQKLGLILNKNTHEKHHKMPYDCNYNITNGHTNFLFERLKIYRIFETIIKAILKVTPHRNT